MFELLESIDRSIFLFINARLANVVTDFAMPIITNGDILAVGYGLVMVLLLIKGSPRFRWLVVFSILTLLLTDQLSASFLKPIIGRPRPCHPASGIGIGEINLLVSCGAGYAMPSAHAANAFGQAILFGLIARPTRFYILGLASLIAISRVFVGVHYPSDVVAGALLGTVIAVFIVSLFRRYENRLVGGASSSPDGQNRDQT
jgi:undecaprenyl-diphosphatase